MFSFKNLSLSAICLIAAAVSASATPITWSLVGLTYDDGTTVTGTFQYDASIADPASRYSNVDFTINAPEPGFSGTTFGANPLYDVIYADQYGLQIANAPANTADFTNVQTNNCDPGKTPIDWLNSGGAISCSGFPGFSGNIYNPSPATLINPDGTPYNTAAFGTSLFALTPLPADPGFDPGTTLQPLNVAVAGFCAEALCYDYISPGVAGQGAFFATDGPAPPPGSTPEPSTFLLGGSVLAVGLFRRKLLKRS